MTSASGVAGRRRCKRNTLGRTGLGRRRIQTDLTVWDQNGALRRLASVSSGAVREMFKRTTLGVKRVPVDVNCLKLGASSGGSEPPLSFLSSSSLSMTVFGMTASGGTGGCREIRGGGGRRC